MIVMRNYNQLYLLINAALYDKVASVVDMAPPKVLDWTRNQETSGSGVDARVLQRPSTEYYCGSNSAVHEA